MDRGSLAVALGRLSWNAPSTPGPTHQSYHDPLYPMLGLDYGNCISPNQKRKKRGKMAAMTAEAMTLMSSMEGDTSEANPGTEPIGSSEAGTAHLLVTVTEVSVPDSEAEGQ